MKEEKFWEKGLDKEQKTNETETKEKIEKTMESLGLKVAVFEKLCMAKSKVFVYPSENCIINEKNGETVNDKEMIKKINALRSELLNKMEAFGFRINYQNEMKKTEDEEGYVVASVGVSDGPHTFTIRILPTKKLAEKNSSMPYIEVSEIMEEK